MIRLLTFLILIWRKRTHLMAPTLLFPVLALAWSYSYTPSYIAETTIGLHPERATPSLIARVNAPYAEDDLTRRLMSDPLLEDALMAAGLFVNLTSLDPHQKRAILDQTKARLTLTQLNSSAFTIRYRNTNGTQTVRFLEQISSDFIDEMLAPERLDVEESLLALSQQIQHYNTQYKQHQQTLNELMAPADTSEEQLRKIVVAEFNIQKAKAQKQLAQQDYETLLRKAQGFSARTKLASADTPLYLLSIPTLISDTSNRPSHLWYALVAALVGLLVGTLTALKSHFKPNTFLNEQHIQQALGIRVVGQIPHLGSIQTTKNRIVTDPHHKN